MEIATRKLLLNFAYFLRIVTFLVALLFATKSRIQWKINRYFHASVRSFKNFTLIIKLCTISSIFRGRTNQDEPTSSMKFTYRDLKILPFLSFVETLGETARRRRTKRIIFSYLVDSKLFFHFIFLFPQQKYSFNKSGEIETWIDSFHVKW